MTGCGFICLFIQMLRPNVMLSAILRFYGFGGKMQFYGFGEKIRFYGFGGKIRFYGFGGKIRFYDFGGTIRFYDFGGKYDFAALAENMILRFWREKGIYNFDVK